MSKDAKKIRGKDSRENMWKIEEKEWKGCIKGKGK